MALGGNVLRQHVVEFIRGTGIVTDGVVDATSLNGPWSWQVPDGVVDVFLDGCGPGAGGGGGWNTGISLSGAGGGGSGQVVQGLRMTVLPNSILAVTVAPGGLGGAAGVVPADPGNVVISGFLPGTPLAGMNESPNLSTLFLRGGSAGITSSSSGGEGGKAGSGRFDFGMESAKLGPANAATADNGASTGNVASFTMGQSFTYGHGAAAGGNASTTGSVAGGRGGALEFRGSLFWTSGIASTRSLGDTTGTVSRGGGGDGGSTYFGLGGKGGNGGAPGGNATGYGAGGGGGGGGAAGGNGSDGYVRFIYWSMD